MEEFIFRNMVSQKNRISTIKNLKGKVTIVMIAHNKDSLKNCDYIFELNSSKLMRLDSIT